jgi:hypothetical protein
MDKRIQVDETAVGCEAVGKRAYGEGVPGGR